VIPRWSAASIRVQLTGRYAVVLCLMLAAYAVATFVAVRHEFFEQLDEQLLEEAETAEGLLRPTAEGRVAPAADRHHDGDGDEDRGYDVWSSDDRLLYRSGADFALPPAPARPSSPSLRYESVDAAGHAVRVLTRTATVGGHPVALRVFRSEDRLRVQLGEVLSVLVLGFPLVIVVAGVAGYVLARRALAPIDHLSSEARRITAERLHQRLSVPNQRDEIGRLAAVINDAFARLDASFGQLRRFTADASHELRTPLAVIRSIGEAGLGETRTPAEYKQAMGSMLEEVDRLTGLVDTLLRLSYGDAGTVRLAREAVNLGQLTREVAASLSVLAEERNQRFELAAPDVVIDADRLVLREAMMNVLDNAIRYSPPSSTIVIHVGAETGQAAVTVTDEGPGIAPEYRDRIFDRFFRLDEARSRDSGGTGLGLAIAKWAVEIHGGRLSVAAGVHGGSVFRIAVPMHAISSAGARPL